MVGRFAPIRRNVFGEYDRAVFVTFEGPEGAGKSTLIASLAAVLRDRGHAVLTTREPGSGEFGQKIRAILLEGDAIDPRAELFLFLADRAQHVAVTVRPALERGEIVLCDRFGDSTVVYQGVARGLDPDLARKLNEIATGAVRPNLTLLLDLEVEMGLSRIQSKDRLDREPISFHQKVRSGFLAEAAREPDRWVVLDATKPPDELQRNALRVLESRMAQTT